MLLLICLCLGQSALAQEKPKRKKVAVVLSGGGAKGMAHIGVLKVLERAGIPVDIITGTSMGSIIGGLYACGRDAAYLDSIVRAQDWGYVLSDHEDLSHQSLSEREKRNIYFLTTSLNLEKKTVDSDGGFIIGKNIYTLFNALTAPYNDSIDFNKLPIPFACVATNIVDNSEYDFHSGVLSTAMRASMSIPGAFSPVRMGDKVLVDGGLRNNFPADIAREMGADYIIGVTVQGKAKTADELASTSAILSQIVDVNCKNKYEENLAITDIPIRVNTSGYGSASFNNVAIDTLIRRGEEAAMEHWDDIVKLREKLGIAPPSSARHGLKPRMMVIRQPLLSSTKYKIGELVFENMTPSDEHFIRSKFKLNEGDSIDANRADLATTSMRLDLFYKSANFMITNNAVNEPNGEKSAKVVFVAGPKKTNEVYLGIRFDREEMVALQANVAFPLRTKLPTELDFTLRLGKRIMGRVDFEFHPTSVIRPTISYVYRHNDINLYEYGDRSYNITYNQHSVRAYPVNFNVRNFNVGIGAEWNYYNFQNLLVDRKPEHQVEQPDNLHLFSYHGVINYNSENEWYFPRKGAKFNAKYSYYTDNFVTLKDHSGISEVSAMWRMSFPVGSFFTFQPMLYGRLLMGTAPPFIISNAIGGEWFGHYVEQQVPFAGIGYMEQAWDKLVAMQLKGQFNLTQNNIILLRFAAGQNADKFSQLLDHSTMLGTSVSYYYNTPFGPLGATLGYCNITEKISFNVNLGFVF